MSNKVMIAIFAIIPIIVLALWGVSSVPKPTPEGRAPLQVGAVVRFQLHSWACDGRNIVEEVQSQLRTWQKDPSLSELEQRYKDRDAPARALGCVRLPNATDPSKVAQAPRSGDYSVHPAPVCVAIEGYNRRCLWLHVGT